MAEGETSDEKGPAPAGGSVMPIKLIIIIALVALIMGVGGAIVAVKFLGDSSKGFDHAESHGAEGDSRADAGKQGTGVIPGVMYDLEPFIVNLADAPEIRYLKITIKLEVENEAVSAEVAARTVPIRDTILVLLSSKDVNTVRTPQGKFQLRDEITQRINGLLQKPGIRAAYFTDFVVQ